MTDQFETPNVWISVMIERDRVGPLTLYYGIVVIREHGGLGRTVSIGYTIRNRPKPTAGSSGWITMFGYNNKYFRGIFDSNKETGRKLLKLLNKYVMQMKRLHDQQMLEKARSEVSPQELLAMALRGEDPCARVSNSDMWIVDAEDVQIARLIEFAFRMRPNPLTRHEDK